MRNIFIPHIKILGNGKTIFVILKEEMILKVDL